MQRIVLSLLIAILALGSFGFQAEASGSIQGEDFYFAGFVTPHSVLYEDHSEFGPRYLTVKDGVYYGASIESGRQSRDTLAIWKLGTPSSELETTRPIKVGGIYSGGAYSFLEFLTNLDGTQITAVVERHYSLNNTGMHSVPEIQVWDLSTPTAPKLISQTQVISIGEWLAWGADLRVTSFSVKENGIILSAKWQADRPLKASVVMEFTSPVLASQLQLTRRIDLPNVRVEALYQEPITGLFIADLSSEGYCLLKTQPKSFKNLFCDIR